MVAGPGLDRPVPQPPRESVRPHRRQRGGRSAGPLLVGLAVGMVVLVLVLGVAWLSGGLSYAAWWLTTTTPPAVSLAGPSAVVRGPIQVAVQIPPRTQLLGAMVDGQPLAAGPTLTIDTATLPDGPHRVQVEAEDQSFRRNRAEATFDLRTDNTPPRLTLDIQPGEVSQGHTWYLRVQTNEQAAVEATLDGKPLTIQAGNAFGWVAGGIDADAEPKDLPLVVAGTDGAGNRSEQQATMHVVKTQYTSDRVDVSASLLPLLQPQVRAAEDAHLAPTYANVTQPKLWEGAFRMPVSGEIITQYGEVRSYNGNPFEGHHAGIDIAAPLSRPVVAPARARVALIEKVQLRGNVVVLDHGLGVFTTYAHLSEINVQVGQEIAAGQPFAKVGTTGLSEGPHLHWELWVGGVNVDPVEWTKRSVP